MINYIKLLSEQSNKYGDLLIELMDYHNVMSLRDITNEMAKEFYDRRIGNERNMQQKRNLNKGRSDK